jgi:hypothetical protein
MAGAFAAFGAFLEVWRGVLQRRVHQAAVRIVAAPVGGSFGRWLALAVFGWRSAPGL